MSSDDNCAGHTPEASDNRSSRVYLVPPLATVKERERETDRVEERPTTKTYRMMMMMMRVANRHY